MVQEGSDDKLKELASYFDIENISLLESVPEVESWNPNSFSVFLSHLTIDKVRTAEIQTELERYNISSFLAHNDIEIGLKWEDAIENALMSCDALVALLTPRFHESNWTDQEIGFVMSRGKKIITVRLGKDPYGFIGKFQGIQGMDKSTFTICKEIFIALANNHKTSKKMSQAIVNKFRNCSNYAEAKETIALIETLTYFDDSLIDIIESASNKNSQIQESYGVPQRVRSIVDAYRLTIQTN